MSGRNDIVVIKKGTMDPNEARKLALMTGKVVAFVDNPEDIKVIGTAEDVEGDGKAEFISEGTEEDYKKLSNKDSGVDKWLDRLKKLV